MDMAEEVLIANGIVFAYASGEDTTQTLPDLAWNEPNGPFVGGALNPYSERRIPNSRHATIYAFDGQTGRELWSSGNQITSWNHWSGMTVANGRVYLGTFDGTLYSFGVPAAQSAK
jgi:outer membrane protein assembly factor BamB